MHQTLSPYTFFKAFCRVSDFHVCDDHLFYDNLRYLVHYQALL